MAFTYLKVKPTKCLCLLPVVLVLVSVLVLRIWSYLVYITVKKYKLVRQPVCLSCLFSSKFMLIINLGYGLLFRKLPCPVYRSAMQYASGVRVFRQSVAETFDNRSGAGHLRDSSRNSHSSGRTSSFVSLNFLLIVSVVRGQNAGVISTQITSDAASQCEAL